MELLAESVTRAAIGRAHFIKTDENLHMNKQELAKYVSETVKMLNKNGFDLSREPKQGKRRIFFAPHITANPSEIVEYAKIAVDNRVNALCFSPHFAGDFEFIRKIYQMGEKYQVSIYAHTAEMNRFCGDSNYTCGDDPRVVYLLTALSEAVFIQLPKIGNYICPTDVKKRPIIERLKKEGLEGNNGMTLAIAGGLGPENIGYNY